MGFLNFFKLMKSISFFNSIIIILFRLNIIWTQAQNFKSKYTIDRPLE